MSKLSAIEAVSKAIQDLLPEWMAEDGRVEDIDLARAALTALSENITVEMVEAGENAMIYPADDIIRNQAEQVFRAMLNQAIKEQGQ